MYSAAALLPSTLPRSTIVTAPPPSGASDSPVRRARCVRIEASSIPAAAALATFGGGSSGLEASSAVRALVSGATPLFSGPQPRSTANTKTKKAPSTAVILRLTGVPRSSPTLLLSDHPRALGDVSSRRQRRFPGQDHTPKLGRPDAVACRSLPAYPRAPKCSYPLSTHYRRTEQPARNERLR